MSFSVDTAGLGGLPDQLDRRKHDALLGEQYVSDHTKLTYRGVLDLVTGTHERLVQQVRDYLDVFARKTAGNAGDAVRIAIDYYQHTDATAAAALDATYPALPLDTRSHSADRDGTGPSGFTDPVHPADRYVAPPDYSAQYPDEPEALSSISFAGSGRQVIIHATEIGEALGLCHRWDPYEAILKPVTGDWKGLRACADVFDHVADAIGDVAEDLSSGADALPPVWTGNAADGVNDFFRRVVTELYGAVQPLKDTGTAYQNAAEGAFQTFHALGGVIDDLIDEAIAFVLIGEAAEATSEFGVGLVLGAADVVYEMYKLDRLVKHGIDLYNAVVAMMHAFNAARAGGPLVGASLTLPTVDEAQLRLPGGQSAVGRPRISNPHK
jgi:hypothetical protein